MPGAPKAVRPIDSAVLEASCSRRCWACSTGDQFATTDQVRYVRELGAATAPVDSGDASAAFLLRAPTVDQVRAVADAGAVMPQKSTYFFPKLHCGFLINPLDASDATALARVLPDACRRTSRSRSPSMPTRDDREPVVGRGRAAMTRR